MKIYSCNITTVSDAELDTWFAAMSEERKKSVMRLQNENKRKAKIAADNLCRLAISEHCAVDAKSIKISLSEDGKPFAVDCNVNFNISHSGNWVICAVSENEIGIDIEKIRSVNPRAAEKFACAEELKYIASHENGFFEIWTLKEAYFKCIGTGLGADIKTVSFEVKENGIACSENGFDCSFVRIDGEYICSVCEKRK